MKRCSNITCLALLAALLVGAPASAQSRPRVTSRQALVDGLRHETFIVTLDDGAVARGNVVRVAHRSTLRVEPVHAHGKIPGTSKTSRMAARQLPRGGLVTMNGGFWLPAAGGKPHGVAMTDRQLFTGPRTQWGRPGHRGTLGIRSDGSTIFSRLGGGLKLKRPGRKAVKIDDVNYVPLKVGGDGSGELLLYTPQWANAAPAPNGAVVATLRKLTLPVLGTAVATVAGVTTATGPVAIPAGGGVLMAYGRARRRLEALTAGAKARIVVDVDPLDVTDETWVESADALPGGPYVVRGRRMTPPDDWVAEGFSHEQHNGPRHPRTAIADTRDGTVLMVTVDGRQSHSAGMTMWELADLLIDLGAVNGLSLDGGGSTTMTVLGRIRNRYSDPVERPVASALVARYRPDLTVRDAARTACPPGRVPDPGFTDVAGNVHRRTIACLAWYGITAGRTASTYAPRRSVTRAQMASFLARMIDHAATHRGAGRAGRALPANGPRAFTDVARRSPHATAVRRLAAAGIVSGGPGRLSRTRFGPGQRITRAQMATLLDRSVTYIRRRALRDGGNVFADDARLTHEAAINRLARAGIAQGRSPGLFGPSGEVSRAAMASFVQRTMEVLCAGGTTSPPG